MPMMAGKIFSALLALGFPIAVLFCGDAVMSGASGRAAAIHQLTDGKPNGPRPLNQRWFGYGSDAAQAYWCWLTPAGRQVEKRFLALDLLFPLLYGGALAASLGWVWTALERPFHPAWILAPLVMITMADWLENLIQLAQLRHYMSSNEQYVQSRWIQLSSCATIVKLWLTSGLYITLVGLILNFLFTFSGRRLANDAAK
ncbi:MAG: conserved membrane protein of unknown function [Nitrospira sp.]|nr:MAG: conserved membrane protein of unknown function [Nitrospira sp.]